MLKSVPGGKRPVLCPNAEPQPTELPAHLSLSSLREGVVYSVRTEHGPPAIVVLRSGVPFAFEAKCPHMGADLTQATCVGPDNRISCPWHGYRFNAETGVVVENPNEAAMRVVRVASPNFDPDLKPPFKLRDCAIEIRDGLVYVK